MLCSVSSWGMGIFEAAQKAADLTGVSVCSIRKWAAMYLVCMIGTTAEEVMTQQWKSCSTQIKEKGLKSNYA